MESSVKVTETFDLQETPTSSVKESAGDDSTTKSYGVIDIETSDVEGMDDDATFID